MLVMTGWSCPCDENITRFGTKTVFNAVCRSAFGGAALGSQEIAFCFILALGLDRDVLVGLGRNDAKDTRCPGTFWVFFAAACNDCIAAETGSQDHPGYEANKTAS